MVRVLNDVNYVIQKVPGGRLQICHVDRLLRYEEEPPAVWVRFDNENNRSPELFDRENSSSSSRNEPAAVQGAKN